MTFVGDAEWGFGYLHGWDIYSDRDNQHILQFGRWRLIWPASDRKYRKAQQTERERFYTERGNGA